MRGSGDTICAIVTPPGRGGVGIVRVSGPRVPALAEALAGRLPSPRQARYARFLGDGGEVLDEGLVLYFPGPNSFTGEDVLELQGHGGPIIMDRLLRRAIELGARMARPGEFSERAFLNGKLDLAQAEAVADLIAAGTEAGARAAVRSLQGEFSALIARLVESLIELRIYVESAIDFPDEEIDFLSDGQVAERLRRIQRELHGVSLSAQRGRLLRDGMTVVIAGRPNAGKSSLLNRLAGYEAAIVTEIEGTTRDVLREHIHLDGMPLHVIDTAGLRESPDRVEQEGIRRAWQAIEGADRVLLLVDDRIGLSTIEEDVIARLPSTVGVTILRNKIDLTARPAGLTETDAQHAELSLSVHTGEGLDALRDHLKALMGYQEAEGAIIARRRHLEALSRASAHLERGSEQLHVHRAGELLAEELRQAQHALGEITGEFTNDELLGRIFSSFCIGK